MSEPKLLSLTPESQLFFDSNFSQIQTRTLVLENITKTNVAFKVKTTALKAYLVKPSNAVVKPGEKREVQIMLQKLSEKPKNHDHRFLVQAVATDMEDIANKEAWAELQRSGTVQEFRLSVMFPEPTGTTDTNYSGKGSDNRDLRSKYDELATYTQKLETQKSLFEADMTKLESQAGPKSRGYQLWQIVAAVVLALFVAKVVERVMAMQGVKGK